MTVSAPQANGATRPAQLDASLLKIDLAGTLKPVPPAGTYGFGDIKTDHMLIVTFDPVSGWSAPHIKPYGPLELDPSSNCLQYCTNIFEGMKAYADPQGKPRMSRPDKNMARLNSSALRMALPTFDPEALLTCIKKLVNIESRWIPLLPGHSLYIRPTIIGTKPSIKVGASDAATLYVIVTPAGPYFPNSATGVSLLAVGEHVRSWPGGTGGYKLGLNYSPGFVPQRAAAQLGYVQVLWLLGAEKIITEAGAMNFFVVVKREDGGVDVITPPLDGTILPGITRDSALCLLRAHSKAPTEQRILNLPADLQVHVHERAVTMHELAAWAAQGRLLEAFGTGTAVLVVAIDRIGDVVDEGSLRAIGEGDGAATNGAPNKAVNGVAQNVTNGAAKKTVVNDILTEAQGGLGPVGQALWDRLLGVAEGRDQFEGWSVACE